MWLLRTQSASTPTSSNSPKDNNNTSNLNPWESTASERGSSSPKNRLSYTLSPSKSLVFWFPSSSWYLAHPIWLLRWSLHSSSLSPKPWRSPQQQNFTTCRVSWYQLDTKVTACLGLCRPGLLAHAAHGRPFQTTQTTPSIWYCRGRILYSVPGISLDFYFCGLFPSTSTKRIHPRRNLHIHLSRFQRRSTCKVPGTLCVRSLIILKQHRLVIEIDEIIHCIVIDLLYCRIRQIFYTK